MKKYLFYIAIAMLFMACGNAATETDSVTKELTPEEEQVFVEQESEVIEESVIEVKSEVKESEQQVKELLKDI
jgi:hypothetical protein